MKYRFSILSKIQMLLCRQNSIAWMAIAACVLMLPGLFSGLVGDDYVIRAVDRSTVSGRCTIESGNPKKNALFLFNRIVSAY
jgi:hypothetical protein